MKENNITPVPVACHDKKSHVVTHLYHLDLNNVMMPSVTSDTDIGNKGIT